MARQVLATLSEFFGPDPRKSLVSKYDVYGDTSVMRSLPAGAQSTTSLTRAASSDQQVRVPINTSNIRNGSNVVRAWERIVRFCDEHYEEMRDTLNWPATSDKLNWLQHGLGQALPQAVCEWLMCCDGQEAQSYTSCPDGLFFGLPFLSSEEILREWQFWRHVDKDAHVGGNPQIKKRMASCPPGWVRKEYSCAGWIPLIADGLGNYIGVDLLPDPQGEGKPGQVIVFGRDFDTKMVVYGCDGSDGWAKFLMSFSEELERGTTFDLTGALDESGVEDDIGYESYFTGSGERAGEVGARFRLTGAYARWPVLECWYDRSARSWERIGYSMPQRRDSMDRSGLSGEVADLSADISASSSTQDPMDPLHRSGGNRSRKSSAHSSPANMRREMTWPGVMEPDASTGSPVRRRRTVVPKPRPLTDLPTIEDVRAMEASEMAQRKHEPSRFGSLKRNSVYLNMAGPSTTVAMEEPVEMSLCPSKSSSEGGGVVAHDVPSSTIDMSGDISTQYVHKSSAMKSTARLLDMQ